MSFAPSERVVEMRERLERFMEEHIYPVEQAYYAFVEDQNNLWKYPPFFESLKSGAGHCKMQYFDSASENGLYSEPRG